MFGLYEVPVTIEVEEEEMCVYIKVSAENEREAARKAEEIVSTIMLVRGDSDDATRIS